MGVFFGRKVKLPGTRWISKIASLPDGHTTPICKIVEIKLKFILFHFKRFFFLFKMTNPELKES